MTEKEFQAAAEKQQLAEANFKKESATFKQIVKEASKRFHSADKARAAARSEFRIARKSYLDAQDSAQIEANKAEVK